MTSVCDYDVGQVLTWRNRFGLKTALFYTWVLSKVRDFQGALDQNMVIEQNNRKIDTTMGMTKLLSNERDAVAQW